MRRKRICFKQAGAAVWNGDLGIGAGSGIRAVYIENKIFSSIEPEIKELIKLLVASIKTAKRSMKNGYWGTRA